MVKKHHQSKNDGERRAKDYGGFEINVPKIKDKVSMKRADNHGKRDTSSSRPTYRGIVSSIRDTVVSTASILQQGFVTVFPPLPHIPDEYRKKIEAKNRIEAREMSEARRRIDIGIREEELKLKNQLDKIEKTTEKESSDRSDVEIVTTDQIETRNDLIGDGSKQSTETDLLKSQNEDFIINKPQCCDIEINKRSNSEIEKPDRSKENRNCTNSTLIQNHKDIVSQKINELNTDVMLCLNGDDETSRKLRYTPRKEEVSMYEPVSLFEEEKQTYNKELIQDTRFNKELNTRTKHRMHAHQIYDEKEQSIRLPNYIHAPEITESNNITFANLLVHKDDTMLKYNTEKGENHINIYPDKIRLNSNLLKSSPIIENRFVNGRTTKTTRKLSPLKIYETKSIFCPKGYQRHSEETYKSKHTMNVPELQSSELFEKCNRESLPLENSFNRIFGGQNKKIKDIIKSTDNKYINKHNVYSTTQCPPRDNSKLSYETKPNINRILDYCNKNFLCKDNKELLKSTEIFSKCNNEYIPLENSFCKIFCINGKSPITEENKKIDNIIKDSNLQIPLISENTPPIIRFNSSKTITECLQFRIAKRENDNTEENIPSKIMRTLSNEVINSIPNTNNTDMDSDYITINSSEESIYRTKDRLMDIYLDEQYAVVMEGRERDNPITIKTNSEIDPSICSYECYRTSHNRKKKTRYSYNETIEISENSISQNENYHMKADRQDFALEDESKKCETISTELNTEDSDVIVNNSKASTEQSCSFSSELTSDAQSEVYEENDIFTKQIKHPEEKQKNTLPVICQKTYQLRENTYNQSVDKLNNLISPATKEVQKNIQLKNNQSPKKISFKHKISLNQNINESQVNELEKEVKPKEDHLSSKLDGISLSNNGCKFEEGKHEFSPINQLYESSNEDSADTSFSIDTLESESTDISGLPSRHLTAEQILQLQRIRSAEMIQDIDPQISPKIEEHHTTSKDQQPTPEVVDHDIKSKVRSKNTSTVEKKFQKLIPYEEFEKIPILPTGQCTSILCTPHTNNQSLRSEQVSLNGQENKTTIRSGITNLVSSIAKPPEMKKANSNIKISTSKLFKNISTNECTISPSNNIVLGKMTPFKPFASPLTSPMTQPIRDKTVFKRPLEVDHRKKNNGHQTMFSRNNNSIHISNQKNKHIQNLEPLKKDAINCQLKIAHTNIPVGKATNIANDNKDEISKINPKNKPLKKNVLPPPRKSSITTANNFNRSKNSKTYLHSKEKIDDKSSIKSRKILDLTVKPSED